MRLFDNRAVAYLVKVLLIGFAVYLVAALAILIVILLYDVTLAPLFGMTHFDAVAASRDRAVAWFSIGIAAAAMWPFRRS